MTRVATKKDPGRFDGLSEEIYQAVWAFGRRDKPSNPSANWKGIIEHLAFIDDAEKVYPNNRLLLHKRLNRLDEALELLEEHPTVVPTADLSATRLRLASQCIAIVPSRFPKNTPFGAACMSAWVRGHRTLAKHGVPRGDERDAALMRFDAAVHAMEFAPRTHAEADLLTAEPHKALLALGPTMPWMSATEHAPVKSTPGKPAAAPKRRG
jgi:hypothetical protein